MRRPATWLQVLALALGLLAGSARAGACCQRDTGGPRASAVGEHQADVPGTELPCGCAPGCTGCGCGCEHRPPSPAGATAIPSDSRPEVPSPLEGPGIEPAGSPAVTEAWADPPRPGGRGPPGRLRPRKGDSLLRHQAVLPLRS